MYYILNGHDVVAVSVEKWGLWFGEADRGVAKSTIGDATISTVFLGIDHSWDGPPPMLFETMVFGGLLDEEQERCSTWAEAKVMHKQMCERVNSL